MLAFVVHQIVGTWGIAFLAAVGLTSLFDLIPDSASWKPSMRFVHWLLTENPFYPVQIMAGLYLGWRIGRRFQHKSMLWIWVLPLLVCAMPWWLGLSLFPSGRQYSHDPAQSGHSSRTTLAGAASHGLAA